MEILFSWKFGNDIVHTMPLEAIRQGTSEAFQLLARAMLTGAND